MLTREIVIMSNISWVYAHLHVYILYVKGFYNKCMNYVNLI